MTTELDCITPDWPVPSNVRALTTTRHGGVSRGRFSSFNLAEHVGDDPDAVRRNRAHLCEVFALPAAPLWLTQVHGTNVVEASAVRPGVVADGAVTDRPGLVLAVLTADCVPVFLFDRSGTKVALLHAGWRGLAGGVIEAGVRATGGSGNDLLAHLGPGIGRDAYEVGEDVRQAFTDQDPTTAPAFRPKGNGRWLADMYTLARMRLQAAGVAHISGGNYCTFRDHNRFFSFRRDQRCGRMASLIWLEPI